MNLFTGKCKEKFDRWLWLEIGDTLQHIENKDFRLQQGVYLDFLRSEGIYLNIDNNSKQALYSLIDYSKHRSGVNYSVGIFEDDIKALKSAITKGGEIINERGG